ncbi:hypothetical protein COEREDRAFT_89022 [Coemansia reversa NRRL 1564]|uniref:BZIP domain-containing protein n=1 Tax=Coemansia reversa (strain ATCC 12441 / NRRL 1564) TaxID=763665 RepID=A0A2G5B4Y0_COERN|nr:hypothetical protein COEREDRAFT_89022 [Coemansia reversa NRRL 1564]|eukprot:PIA14064.1 hypothetical protein COEREDRAFT_89022 [Coemansia reversa NRRL 1564]
MKRIGQKEVTERRRQNRDAAARHRQRQQERLDGLEKREAILKQRVGELELGIETLKHEREGLELPKRDTFTDTMLGMLVNVDELRNSLTKCMNDSKSIINELEHIADTVSKQRGIQEQEDLDKNIVSSS